MAPVADRVVAPALTEYIYVGAFLFQPRFRGVVSNIVSYLMGADATSSRHGSSTSRNWFPITQIAARV